MYSLKNDLVEVKISEIGAEVKSFKFINENYDYMWQADPKVWGRTSPILFPVVGGLKNDGFIYGGKKYNMLKHGFVRKAKFEIIETSKNKIIFKYIWNEETLKVFPFKFEFFVTYILNKAKLIMDFKVKNLSEDEMYFSVGGHPGFNCPITDLIKVEDYYFEFEKTEDADTLFVEGPLIATSTKECLKNTNILKMKENIFENDAIIFEKLNSNYVSIKNTKNKRSIKLDFGKMKYIAFWNKPGASFICIEPWQGIADFVNASGKIEEKIGIIKLDGNKIYKSHFDFEIIK